MIQPLTTPDPCRCPLCAQPNACSMATPGQSASGPCWCTMVQFSPALLQQVPEAARNRACICATCVAASQASSPEPSQELLQTGRA
jgi:hypothetical protein